MRLVWRILRGVVRGVGWGLVVLGGVVAVVGSVVWVRSYWVFDRWKLQHMVGKEEFKWELKTNRGRVVLDLDWLERPDWAPRVETRFSHEGGAVVTNYGRGPGGFWARHGFGWVRNEDTVVYWNGPIEDLRWVAKPPTGKVVYYRFGVQAWAVVLVFGLPVGVRAVMWGRRWWKRRGWRREGRCLRCGYDLRATPERCPECGLGVDRKLVESRTLLDAAHERAG